ncbi:uncharacterized protein LOC131638461 [Vicia villosa]|uniref:uncharacterized protein LOC131638461 n=1 Tax=Vicia villosa TaxID=3911 RepID=UPI00273C30BE|nr:uncharacterized protein LOC131638461 [Vicia villosa]
MATKGCNKLPTIFYLNKSLQDIIEEVKRRNICLFDILPVVKSDLLVPLVEELLSYYDHEKNLFEINGHKLAVTLEDILYITGLPIRGKPIMKASKENGAFERVFGINNKKPCSIKRLKELAGNSNLDIDTRVKAALLVLIACVVIPTGDTHTIRGDFVSYVERLEDVDNYAWGAALLAFLYSGICKWKVGRQKSVIDGNLWVVLAFFLIRIPDLVEAIDLNLNLDGQQVPLLLPVVEAVSTISHNHKPTYISKVQKMLDTLTEEQICWKPYKLDLHRPILRDQEMYKLLLAPICCMSAVHYHTPHYVHKQLEELEVVDVNKIMWKLPKCKKRKGNSGPTPQTFLSDFELQQWNEGRLVINYLQGHEDDGMVYQPGSHVENVMVDKPEASNARDVYSFIHVVDLSETSMVDQPRRNVENVMDDQPDRHVGIVMVHQPETSNSRDVDSEVHVDDQPEKSIHADDHELKRMKHVGSASVDEKEDFEVQIVEEAGISFPDGFSKLEINPCPVAGNENTKISDYTRQLLWETHNSCLHDLDTSATESIDEPQKIQSGMVDHECTKEASVVAVLCESIEKQGDEVTVSSIKDDKEAIQEHHDKPYSKLSEPPRNGSKGKTPAKRSEKGDRSTSVPLSPSSGFQLLQSNEAHQYRNIDSISTKPFSDLNASASQSVMFQQPFMDVQQVQLRAQIFVYGALIQGIVPEEAYMLLAFGGSDGGRNFWEKAWSSYLERQQSHKSNLINPETPLQLLSGTRTPDLAVKQSELHGTGISSPLGLASSKGTPTIVNPFIHLSSPLWNLPSPSQAFVSLHPNQTPPLRNFLGYNTSMISQSPLFGPQIASASPPPDNSSNLSASPLTLADRLKSGWNVEKRIMSDESLTKIEEAKVNAKEASASALQAKLMSDEALIFSGHESSCGTYFTKGTSNLRKTTPASILKGASEINKMFNIDKNIKNEKNPDAHRLARSGLRKEVPKHYVARGTSRINDGNDSDKTAVSLIPHASGSRGWKNSSIKDTKEKFGADCKPTSKSGKPQVLSRVIPSKQKPLSKSRNHDLTCRTERTRDSSRHVNNATQRENQMERASYSESSGARKTSNSSRASSTDSHPTKKPLGSRVSKGKLAHADGRWG